MHLNVQGHHVEVTDSLRGYVETKIKKVERHFDMVSDVNCILTVEKLQSFFTGGIPPLPPLYLPYISPISLSVPEP